MCHESLLRLELCTYLVPSVLALVDGAVEVLYRVIPRTVKPFPTCSPSPTYPILSQLDHSVKLSPFKVHFQLEELLAASTTSNTRILSPHRVLPLDLLSPRFYSSYWSPQNPPTKVHFLSLKGCI